MSVVFVVAPLLIGEWAVLSAAIAGGAAALGYSALRERQAEETVIRQQTGVELLLEDGDSLASAVGRGESLTVARDGISATFRRDGRGRCTVHVDGHGRTHAELESAGRELMDRVRQQFAYTRVTEELRERGFDVVEERVEADQSIRLRVRRWS